LVSPLSNARATGVDRSKHHAFQRTKRSRHARGV